VPDEAGLLQTHHEAGAGRSNVAGGTPPKAAEVIENVYPPDWPYLKHCIDPHSPGGLFDFSLSECGAGQKPDFGKNASIAIVGAGPAGVSIARLLSDRGFRNIKLIESSDRVGGKSKRFEVDGEPHEMGTAFVAGKYECIEAWGRMVGLTEVPVSSAGWAVSSEKALLQNMTPPNYGTANVWMADYAFRNHGISPQDFPSEIAKAVQAYFGQWSATMGQVEYMFPSEQQVDFSALNQTFAQWLAERNLEVLTPVFVLSMASAGYGTPAQMPALYGLMWSHPNFLFQSTNAYGMFLEGFQALWERLIASTAGVDLSLKTEIRSISRLNKGVQITYSSGRREFFDWLVMAAPMPQALTLLSDATNEEEALFGSYSYHELVVNMVNLSTTGTLPSDVQVFGWPDIIEEQSDFYRMSLVKGKVVRKMYDADGDETPTGLRHDANIKNFTNPVVSVFQIASPLSSDAELTAVLHDSLETFGIESQLIYRDRWDYMPFFKLEEVVKERKPWRIWDLQGKHRTWWVGSYVSFESVADILDYNLKLVNSRLCGV